MTVKQTTLIGEAEPVLVTAARLAQLLRVSEVSINAWRKAGMPAVRRANQRGVLVWHYSVDDCRAWVKRHQADSVRGETHGGTRANAGRPRMSVVSAVHELRHRAMQVERGEMQKDLRSTVSGEREAVSIPTTVEGIFEDLQAGKLAGVDARTLSQAMMAASKSQEIEIERGELLHKDDVEEVWVGHIQSVRTALRGIPARASQEMRMQFGLKPAETAAVRKIIQQEITKVESFLAMAGGEISAPEGEEESTVEDDSAEGREEQE